jgi:hypothetical protein
MRAPQYLIGEFAPHIGQPAGHFKQKQLYAVHSFGLGCEASLSHKAHDRSISSWIIRHELATLHGGCVAGLTMRQRSASFCAAVSPISARHVSGSAELIISNAADFAVAAGSGPLSDRVGDDCGPGEQAVSKSAVNPAINMRIDPPPFDPAGEIMFRFPQKSMWFQVKPVIDGA